MVRTNTKMGRPLVTLAVPSAVLPRAELIRYCWKLSGVSVSYILSVWNEAYIIPERSLSELYYEYYK